MIKNRLELMSKRVVIVGGGVGGLTAAKALAGADVEITLIDRTNHHLFQPLLYQVASAVLAPSDIATPIREIIRNQKNVRVIMGEVVRFDVNGKKVYLKEGFYDYDYLVVATGVKNCYYGKDEWEKFTRELKTLADALCIREQILLSFEKAERSTSDEDVQKLMTFVIVGGGPTGVESAGALAELSRKAMRGDFRRIDPSRTRIILLEAMDRILCAFDPTLSIRAKTDLEQLGVEVRLNTKITNITDKGVWMHGELIETPNIIWTAGTMATSIIGSLVTRTNQFGRVFVKSDCSIENHPEVFVVGDASLFLQDGKPLPLLAPVAVQQGRYVASIIRKGLVHGKRSPFKYKDKGMVTVIGQNRAVLQANRFKLSGFPAWVAWVFVHIMVLVQFRNRYKVMAEWMRYYFTNRSGARLINGQCLPSHGSIDNRALFF
jgi:NADH dehydrogenase